MTSKLQNGNLSAINQMSSRLETNRLLVSIKTEDHYLDDFFLRQFAAKDRTVKICPLETNKLLSN